VTASRWMLCVSLVLGGACAHTKTTDDGTEKEKQAKEEEQQPERARTEPKAKPPAGDGKGSELHPGKQDAVPVATAPDVLLKPGADDKIRERLKVGGYVDRDDKESAGALRQGIRRFQKEHDLPATGVADHETVKRLGLDPNQIFRQAAVKD
jgi:hypothetical protein